MDNFHLGHNTQKHTHSHTHTEEYTHLSDNSANSAKERGEGRGDVGEREVRGACPVEEKTLGWKKLSLQHFMLIPVRQQNTHNLQKGKQRNDDRSECREREGEERERERERDSQS